MAEIEGAVMGEVETRSSALGYVRQLGDVAGGVLVKSYRNTIRAYYHDIDKESRLVCVDGMIQVVLYDKRVDSVTRGEKQIVTIGSMKPISLMVPAGVAFGYKVVGSEPALVICGKDGGWINETNISVNDVEIGHDWKVQVC